jgi:hypothetical protein
MIEKMAVDSGSAGPCERAAIHENSYRSVGAPGDVLPGCQSSFVRLPISIMNGQAIKPYLFFPLIAILMFPSGAPLRYPGDCVQSPGAPVSTARVVQALSYDPPQFEIEFGACGVAARMGREGDEGTAPPGTTSGR